MEWRSGAFVFAVRLQPCNHSRIKKSEGNNDRNPIRPRSASKRAFHLQSNASKALSSPKHRIQSSSISEAPPTQKERAVNQSARSQSPIPHAEDWGSNQLRCYLQPIEASRRAKGTELEWRSGAFVFAVRLQPCNHSRIKKSEGNNDRNPIRPQSAPKRAPPSPKQRTQRPSISEASPTQKRAGCKSASPLT
ncbi:hypothetical protein ACFSVM_21725 [Paenibacillus shunpengii]|uniref:Uncharacterized protein n=1 Tax=Paenibacillus shunpengii TaxID=2054424 RepID=A0ABW5STL9_9BACL